MQYRSDAARPTSFDGFTPAHVFADTCFLVNIHESCQSFRVRTYNDGDDIS